MFYKLRLYFAKKKFRKLMKKKGLISLDRLRITITSINFTDNYTKGERSISELSKRERLLLVLLYIEKVKRWK